MGAKQKSPIKNWISHVIGLFLSLSIFTCQVLGQQVKSSASTSSSINSDDLRIARLIEEKISAIISRHVPESEFNVMVTLGKSLERKKPEISKQEEKKVSLPYMPDRELAGTGVKDSTPLEELVANASKVKVVVLISSRFDSKAKNRLKSLILQKLGMNEGRGDSVNFDDLRIEAEKQDTKLSLTLQERERDLKESQRTIRELETRRREIEKIHEKDLQAMRASLQQLQAELLESKRTHENLAQDNSSKNSDLNNLRAELRTKESLLNSDKQLSQQEIQKMRQDIQKLDADHRADLIQIEQLQKERSDLRQDIENIDSRLEKATKDLVAKEIELKELRKLKTKTPEETLIKKHFGQGMVAIGLLAIGIFLAAALVFGFKMIALRTEKSVSSIGRAIEKVAINQQTSQVSTLDLHPEGVANHTQTSPSSDQTLVNEAAHVRILRLREEINANLNAHSETILLRHINQLLSKQETIFAAVFALELLGKGQANKLFQRLNQDDQAKVLRFIDAGQHKQPKLQAMLEIGEDIQTRLLAETLVTEDNQLDKDISELLIRLNDRGLIHLSKTIDEELVARLLCYFSANEIAVYFTKIKQNSPQILGKFQRHFVDIPKAKSRLDLDDRVKSSIESTLKIQAQNGDEKYIEFYRQVVDQLDDEASHDLVAEMTESNASLKVYFEDHLISLQTVPSLLKELREEIYSQLSAQELALLLLSLNQGKDMFEELLPSMKDLVREEIGLLRTFNSKKLQDMTKSLEKKLVQKIKLLKGNKTLQELMNSGNQAEGRKTA